VDYNIFIKVLLYKWGPRKRLGLDVVKFILFKGKNEIIIMILKECNINFQVFLQFCRIENLVIFSRNLQN
jgi:hypothetical protein